MISVNIAMHRGVEGRTEGKVPRAPEQKRRVEQAGLEPSRARMVFDDG